MQKLPKSVWSCLVKRETSVRAPLSSTVMVVKDEIGLFSSAPSGRWAAHEITNGWSIHISINALVQLTLFNCSVAMSS